MREILFRGKKKDNGEWFEGDLLREKDVFGVVNTRIYQIRGNGYFAKYEVDPETVCQYTGLTDKNGEKIFEGDVVAESNYLGIVYFENGEYKITWKDLDEHLRHDIAFWVKERQLEVIGNVYDNPDLLTTSSQSKEGEPK